MPGPRMGPRPKDFDEAVIKQSPTYMKWRQLRFGQKLRYACREFIKGHGEDDERLMRRIMIARRNNIRDHETLKRARKMVQEQHPPPPQELEGTPTVQANTPTNTTALSTAATGHDVANGNTVGTSISAASTVATPDAQTPLVLPAQPSSSHAPLGAQVVTEEDQKSIVALAAAAAASSTLRTTATTTTTTNGEAVVVMPLDDAISKAATAAAVAVAPVDPTETREAMQVSEHVTNLLVVDDGAPVGVVATPGAPSGLTNLSALDGEHDGANESMNDEHARDEMDVPAVEATRSYRAWSELENGMEFVYNQRYTKGQEGHDWLLRKNIWRRMRYRRENKRLVAKYQNSTAKSAPLAIDGSKNGRNSHGMDSTATAGTSPPQQGVGEPSKTAGASSNLPFAAPAVPGGTTAAAATTLPSAWQQAAAAAAATTNADESVAALTMMDAAAVEAAVAAAESFRRSSQEAAQSTNSAALAKTTTALTVSVGLVHNPLPTTTAKTGRLLHPSKPQNSTMDNGLDQPGNSESAPKSVETSRDVPKSTSLTTDASSQSFPQPTSGTVGASTSSNITVSAPVVHNPLQATELAAQLAASVSQQEHASEGGAAPNIIDVVTI